MPRQKKPVEMDRSAAPQTNGNTTASNPERERIAMRAYELYLARGCAEGRAEDDWFCAERELSGGRSREES
jgi:hypothetical protein